MPPRARQASLSVWQSAQLRSSARAKGQLWHRKRHQSLTESLSEEHQRAEVAQEQTQVSNQEAQSRLLSKTSCSLSSLRIRFSGHYSQTSRRFSPEPRCPKPLSLFRSSRANEPHRKLPAAVKRRRVCAGLCKQTTAPTGQIYPRTLTPNREHALEIELSSVRGSRRRARTELCHTEKPPKEKSGSEEEKK